VQQIGGEQRVDTFEHQRATDYPTLTGTSVIVSLPRMSMTLTAIV
jgi:hypothetical protein